MLIGKSKELLPQLKIKDNADPAGLSQPLLLLKAPTNSEIMSKMSAFLSKNSLTAPALKEIKDAMEDGWTQPSPTSKPTKSTEIEIIPTSPEIKLASLPLPAESNGLLPDSLMFRDALNWPMLLSKDPSPLLLMLPFGPHTDLEF
jgi:hypothetical protein